MAAHDRHKFSGSLIKKMSGAPEITMELIVETTPPFTVPESSYNVDIRIEIRYLNKLTISDLGVFGQVFGLLERRVHKTE